MLAIRLQRRGRRSHAQFRIIVQDSRYSPKSEKIVHYLGSYDPHAKAADFDSEKALWYLEHGAQPSNRVAKILRAEKVKLPDWVVIDESRKGKVKKVSKGKKDATTADTPAEDIADVEKQTDEAKNETDANEADPEASASNEPEQSKQEKADEKQSATDTSDGASESKDDKKSSEKTDTSK